MRNLFICALFIILAVYACRDNASTYTENEATEAISPALDSVSTIEENNYNLTTTKNESSQPAYEKVENEVEHFELKKQKSKPTILPSAKPENGTERAASQAQAASSPSASSEPTSSGAQSMPFSGSILEAVKPIAETGNSQPQATIHREEKPGVPGAPSHEAWDKLLQQHVSASGKVNYAGLKNDKAKLEAYLETLKNAPPQGTWSKADKMAYWINAYNAFTIKLIVDNFPTTSITKLHAGKPWDVQWIKLGDKTYSLNNIENDILRPQYKDARIHFAVNCAAKSCPPLLNRAWTATNLESNFEKQAKAFINNSQFNKISPKEVQVSKIFEWYASDFGNLIGYLNKYSDTKINANAKVKYLEYDWALNQ
jgi:hypothetical protein